MLRYLERLLHEKTKDSQSDILLAQWNYDKKAIPSALNMVSSLFPHYSLHDETHSATILNNIARVIGKERFEKFTAIDIWLMLEASYCHDLGMVVSNQKMREALQDDKFFDFFKSVQHNPKNSLHEFACQFELRDRKFYYKSSELNLGYHDGIRFLLAEFFRRQHADRSKSIIANPMLELSIESPRAIIPQRLFKILGDICACHTKDFDDVMQLPVCEVGIDTEDAHPRLISCLLRIGDLLDLDNNRFSEVMLRSLNKIPVDTLQHKAKHLSIQSFRADTQKIEIYARCEDYEVASITQHWFNYIDSEISHQMKNWNNIVPNKDFGYLPTVGNLKVELIGYEYIDGKKKPQFTVDTDKALELLKGAGLYENKYQSIREILQNSVDATLLRIWLEHKDELKNATPQDDIFKDILKNYPIEITLTDQLSKEEKKIPTPEGHTKWKMTIRDHGIGISKHDLRFLMKTGSSSKNIKKDNIVEEMPHWLRPSGVFGIGFQSIFLLTDQVNIRTKNYFDEQFLDMELNNPTSLKDGSILIKKIEPTGHKVKVGTELSFLMDSKNRKQGDPFTDKNTIREEMKIPSEITHQIRSFARESSIVIKFNNKPINNTNNRFDYYDKETHLEIGLQHQPELDRNYKFYYKNQAIKQGNPRIYFTERIKVNIHTPKASEILSIDRNEIIDEYFDLLFENTRQSIFRYLTQKYDNLSPENKLEASLFIHYYHDPKDNFLLNFNLDKYMDWENFRIAEQYNPDKLTLKEIVDFPEIDIIPNYNIQSKNTLSIKNNNSIIEIYDPKGAIYLFLVQILYKKQAMPFFYYEKTTKSFRLKKVKFKNYVTSIACINKENMKIYIYNLHKYLQRAFIPIVDEFEVLGIHGTSSNDNIREPFIYNNTGIDYYYNKMVSPYYGGKVALTEQLYDWVYENRYDAATTREEIVKAYARFVQEFPLTDSNPDQEEH